MIDKYTQNMMLADGQFEKEQQYWLNKLQGEIVLSEFPRDADRTSTVSGSMSAIKYGFPPELSQKLQTIANKSDFALFMILLSGIKYLLHRYASQSEITVGMPVFKQNKQNAVLVNSLLLLKTTLMQDDCTFKQWLAAVKETVTSANEHQNFPYIKLTELLDLPEGNSNQPYLPTLVLLDSIHDRSSIDHVQSNVIFQFSHTEEQVELVLRYNSGVYSEFLMKQIAFHLIHFLRSALNEPDRSLGELELLSLAEKMKLLDEFNMTGASYPLDQTIHGLFEAQVLRTPEEIGASCGEENLTYRQLNERANSLARVLRSHGVGPDDRVGLLAERSLDMIVGIFATLKAGGAYVPLDPDYPQERTQFMLEDSWARVLLAQPHLMGKVPFDGITLDMSDSELYAGDTSDLEPVNGPHDMAYIIYTSGTTGKPKGVMIEHRNVVRLLVHDRLQFDFNERDVWTVFHSFCFDFSVWEMYGALLYGGKCVVVPKTTAQNPKAFAQLLRQEGVTVLNQTPTAFYALIHEELQQPDNGLAVRYVIFGGEALNPVMLKPWKAKYPNTLLINMYGITETTVHVTYKDITDREIETNLSNIGRPIPTLTSYIFDAQRRLVPIGVVGELYVGGDGVARGYLNREELTAERFVMNPYKPEERLYRSGDLTRLLPSGEMEYFGRIDHQVKIRGHRIELGEIETQLLRHERIQEATVLALDDEQGQKFLCAYFIADGEPTVSELRAHIGSDLPAYMIPSHFVKLDRMPLTANGKIDRKALPKPEGGLDSGTAYVAPRTELEAGLAQIWQNVLGCERVGVLDDFFALGGHSLKAMSLITAIHKAYDVEVPLSLMFETSNIEALARYIEVAVVENNGYVAIPPAPQQEVYPVSSAQKRMYIINQFEGAGTGYNMPGIFQLHGKLDRGRLEQAFRHLIIRHETLRTSFETVNGEPVQRVHASVPFEISYIEAIGAEPSHAEIERLIRAFIQPFDLQSSPLLRVGLIQLAVDHHIFMCDMHHIISDGVSMSILVKEFTALYHGETLPELSIQYKDFAVWQHDSLQSEKLKKQEAYWLDAFHGELPQLELPTDYLRPAVQSFEGNHVTLQAGYRIMEGVKRIAAETGSTLYMVLLAAYNVLLAKYSGKEDIIVGTPTAGRSHADVEGLIGMFVGTLAMRNKPEGHKTFKQFLAEVKLNAMKAYSNQDYPFEALLEKLNIVRDISRNPLFDTMFMVQNIDVQEAGFEELQIEPYVVENYISKFDLSLEAKEMESGLSVHLEYSTNLFARETVERLGRHYINLLESIVQEPERKLAELDMLSDEEKQQILTDFNDTKTDYPGELSIAGLFEQQARLTPDHPALVWSGKQLTYCQLNEKANRLARTLMGQGVGPDQAVGLLAERNMELIVGLLGILKAGGAFLLLDLDIPEERMKYMLEDSGARIVLTERHLRQKTAALGAVQVNILDEETGHFDTDGSDLEPKSGPRDLAYVIYTSGSTGKPKGVLIEQRSVVRLVKETNYVQWSANERILQTGALGFDAVTFEFFGALLNGGTLYLTDKSVILDSEKLSAFIAEHRITTMWLTSPLFNQLSQENAGMFAGLRQLLVGGDALSPSHINHVRSKCPGLRLINGYGPTENTTFSTTYPIERDYEGSIPIGRPISNSTAYIVNKYNQLLPVGVPGELCVGGDGVARGYANRPELTAETFVPNPFVEGEVMYRTGDLAKWLPDGAIEYRGRIDQQVKIRGYRIELGEIEAELLKHPAMKDAVVIAREDANGQKFLCAYIVGEQDLGAPEVKAFLSQELPSYMVPAYIVQMEKLPLTANGKIDRRELPEPEGGLGSEAEYAAPRNETEEQLVAIWQDVLGVLQVGIRDDFFLLGGHSLKAMTLLARIKQQLQANVPLRVLFESPTIEALALHIEQADKEAYAAIKPVESRDYYPVSSAQKRMYILGQFEGTGTAYNMPGVMFIEGELNLDTFRQSFIRLVERHESLRSSFDVIDGEPVQIVHGNLQFEIEYIDIVHDALEVGQLVEQFVRPFDLSRAPLLHVGLIHLQPGRHLFLFDMHHIISDGVSMAILVDEFVRLYQGEQLPELTIHYKDFAVWQNGFFQSERMQKQETYWLSQFDGEIPVLDLPTDFSRPSIQSFEGDYMTVGSGRELAEGLKKLAVETGATLYMVLLAAYHVLLAKYSGQEDIVIGTPIAGRPRAELEPVIGMFVNTLALRNRSEGGQTFKQFLASVKDTTLSAFEHQDYPFEAIVEKLNMARDLSRNPLFDTMFSMQNISVRAAQLDDLQFTPYETESRIAKFDLSMEATEEENQIRFNLEYSTRLFNRTTIERLAGHYLRTLHQIVMNPDSLLSEIDMLSDAERYEIIHTFNDTHVTFSMDVTMPQLFEQQAAQTPDRIAISFEGTQWTYRELNERANQLARYLLLTGMGQEDLAAILMHRSPRMIECILAVWKAGGAYVPIDPDYPQQRIRELLADSGAVCLLTEMPYVTPEIKDDFTGVIIPIDADDEVIRQVEENNVKLPPTISNHLAYVIYTSGSTGKPKGAMLEHAGMLNHMDAMISAFRLDEQSVIVQNAPHCFDISVWQLVTALVLGGRTAIYSNELVLNVREFLEQVAADKATVLEVVVSYMAAMLDLPETVALPDLQVVLVTGESIKPPLARKWFERYPHIKLVNAYGPTEASDDITLYVMDNAPELETVPIGKPVQNMHVYVVDSYMKLVPIGVQGELCVSGIGVGRGYLNDPERTQKAFMEDPFRGESGIRMYKTGDLARFLPDGNLEYVGRVDHQVKIRGYRIELGEIEAILLRQEGVKEAVVMDRTDAHSQKYLCAYFTSDDMIPASVLKESLSKELPGYMVPSYFVQMDRLPLTPNGKVNRKALPEPDGGGAQDYTAPSSETERTLCVIWQHVLGIGRVCIHDSFFELGGHSLKAMMLLAQIHRETGVEVPLRTLFEMPTVQQIAKFIDQSSSQNFVSIQPAEHQEYYPLSSAQKRMFILQQFEADSVGYNMPDVMLIEGELDVERFNQAYRALIRRHEALRTSFHTVNGEPRQKVHEDTELRIQIEVYQADSDEDTAKLVQSVIRPFNLSEAPLIRAVLIRRAADKHVFVYDMHHIVSDGVSSGIIASDFAALYAGAERPKLNIQYKDFAVWQNEQFQSGIMQKHEQYWLNKFTGEVPLLNLTTDYPRPQVKSFVGDFVAFGSGSKRMELLNRFAASQGTTLYMVLLAAFNVLLAKYSGQDDLVVGTPIAGRPHADVDNVVGMFVNTLALRSRPETGLTFLEFLQQVKETALQAYEHQDYPFELLVEHLGLQRDLSRNPLFDTIFIFQNTDDAEIELNELQFKPFPLEHKIAKFDLALTAVETEGEIGFNLEYSTKLFNIATVERMGRHLLTLIDSLMDRPDTLLADLNIVTEEEHSQLALFNATHRNVPNDQTLHGLFEEQAALSPEQPAVIFLDRQLTYAQLNTAANRLARTLRDKGVRPESRVGIMAERSLELIVGIMAILKAGGAYVPIDPQYPQERIRYMLEDSGTLLVLTQAKLFTGMSDEIRSAFTGEWLDLDDEQHYAADGSNLDPVNAMTDLAYIIYTSGTTGKPKGVMIEHRSIAGNLLWRKSEYALSTNDNVLQLFSFAFDGFVTSFFTPILAGATVVLMQDEDAKDPFAIKKQIAQHRTTHFISVPSLYAALLECMNAEEAASLRIVTVAGEKVNKHVIERSKQLFPHIELVNEYGPTESSVVATFLRDLAPDKDITIGRPIANTQVYIVNETCRKLQPIGIIGELCIAGDGLARGYLNRGDLTSEKFITNPFTFGGSGSDRMYKTGDLARWLPDGTLEYIGRLDEQVKIRGYRIELEEIEAVLLRHDQVQEAVVVTTEQPNGDYALCAYIVATGSQDMAELRTYLSSELPTYMIPGYFVRMDAMPLTPNGKLDKKALPKPDERSLARAVYVAPRNGTEEQLAGIWQDILGLQQVGIHDNFFEIGGHSLKATMLAARIFEMMQTELPLHYLFQHPTVEKTAQYIDSKELRIDFNKPIALLNRKAERNVFCFPPVGGFGFVFKELADRIDTHALYGLDFIESEDRMERYIDLVTSVQEEGPFIFMGYSAGGNLIFELTQAMENKGFVVSDLIMLDASRKNKVISQSDREVAEEIDALLKEAESDAKYEPYVHNERIRNNVIQKIKSYMVYLNALQNSGSVRANIHHMHNEIKPGSSILSRSTWWNRSTSAQYRSYQGAGRHEDMLDMPYAAKNAEIVKEILSL
ncbi:non-ribosomal peptide synthetase [Paenibacillus sedimenti]|uniref:Amino acid adenylation domain-containing protein n=1 Tax=Paenibacillus sedimenti TaxID=2770274 RepID=A0A926QGR7_9BACL|nr:non-ribosomal peptide synthetase [Paenibacillus sedimenti]MBD0378730.1 amino acid adenylation domain-containing protein [Paenibacillus sedimenti]